MALVDVIDQNSALIGGHCTGIRRQALYLSMQPIDFVLKFPHSAQQKYVHKAWEKEKINGKWIATNWTKKD